MNEKITIDQEFKDLLPVLSGDEKQALEDSIIAEGCREPLVIWQHEGKNILVDGHNRYEICQKHRKQYETKAIPFKDREAVKVWILQNQCARRNLNKDQKLTVAKRMVASGISQKDIAKALGVSQQWVSEKTRIVQEVRKEATQEAVQILRDSGKTQKETAEIVGVSERTVASIDSETRCKITRNGIFAPLTPIAKTEAENKVNQVLSSNSILAKAEKLTESKPIMNEPIQQKAELPKDKCAQCTLKRENEELRQKLEALQREFEGFKNRFRRDPKAPFEEYEEFEDDEDSEKEELGYPEESEDSED